jgi:hypothetical protein
MGVLQPKERRTRWARTLRGEALRGMDHIVVNSPETVELLRAAFTDVPQDRISTITNAYLEVDDPAPPPAEGPGPDERPFRISHTGILAYGRDALAIDLIRGIGALRRHGGPRIELVLTGQKVPAVTEAAEREGVSDQVRVLGWVDRERNLEIQRDSDALLLLQPAQYAEAAIPGKLFEYMGRRRPILAFMPDGSAPRIIRQHGLGRVISSSDPATVAEELGAFLAEVRDRPILPAPPATFSEESTVSDFAAVLTRVLAGSPTDQLPTSRVSPD